MSEAQIDEMSWLFYLDLAAHWAKFPPIHIMLAKFLGFSK